LGVGILLSPIGWDGQPDLTLQPGDGRDVFWIDPRVLYRLHDQTVEVYAEETDEDFTPAPELMHDNTTHSYDNGDGSFQVKNVRSGQSVCILPNCERLGNGIFTLEFGGNNAGTRHRIETK